METWLLWSKGDLGTWWKVSLSLLSKDWASDGRDRNEQGVSQGGGYGKGSEHVDLEWGKHAGKC